MQESEGPLGPVTVPHHQIAKHRFPKKIVWFFCATNGTWGPVDSWFERTQRPADLKFWSMTSILNA